MAIAFNNNNSIIPTYLPTCSMQAGIQSMHWRVCISFNTYNKLQTHYKTISIPAYSNRIDETKQNSTRYIDDNNLYDDVYYVVVCIGFIRLKSYYYYFSLLRLGF